MLKEEREREKGREEIDTERGVRERGERER
jgi:hypothetical protein